MDWKHPFGRDDGKPGPRAASDPDVPVPEPLAAPLAPAVAAVPDAPALGPVDAPGDHGGDVQPLGQPTSDAAGGLADALDFARWVLRPDAHGRLGWELPDAERWWANSPAAGEPLPGVVTVGDAPSFPGDHAPAPACPRCGSLELWWDLWGGVHCQRCDARTFERGLRLLERAERLRGRCGKAPAPVAN